MLLFLQTSKGRRLLRALSLALCAVCPRTALAWGSNATKHDRVHEVEQVEQQWRTAVLAGDAVAMDRILADDYVSLTLQDKVNTKAQQLRRMRERLLVLERMDLSDVKVRVLGDIALVTGRACVRGHSGAHTLDGNYRYTQVLRLLPSGAWIITSFEAHHDAEHGFPLLASQHQPHAG